MSPTLPRRAATPLVLAGLFTTAASIAAWRWARAADLSSSLPAMCETVQATHQGLELAPGVSPWVVADSRPQLARALLYDPEQLDGESLEAFAASALSPALSARLVEVLDVSPELATALVIPDVSAAFDSRCPDLPPHLAARCDRQAWAALQVELPRALADVLGAPSSALAADAAAMACTDTFLADRVRGAVASPGAPMPRQLRARALALFLASCAHPGDDDAIDAMAEPPPLQWMAALELVRAGQPVDGSEPGSMTATLGRYGQLISSSSTAVPSSP